MYREFADALVMSRDARQCTQERLAEICNISRQSISLYECGESLPSEKVMKVLMEKLDNPYLGYAWLRSNEIGRSILPNAPMRVLSASVLNLHVEINDVAQRQFESAKIARDDKVDMHEIPAWEKYKQLVQKVIAWGFSVTFASTAKEKPPVLAHRR